MSAGQDNGDSLVSIGIGTLVPTVLCSVLGAFTAFASWSLPEPTAMTIGATLGNFVSGAIVGGVLGFFVGWFMSWNAYVMGALHERSEMAAVWGVIPALVFGASLGPLFGGASGIVFGHLVDGALFGLYMGPVAGLLAWEITFFLSNMKQPQHH